MMEIAVEAEGVAETQSVSQVETPDEALVEDATTAEDEIAAAAAALSALAASAAAAPGAEVSVRETDTVEAAEPHGDQPRDITTAFRGLLTSSAA